MKKTYIQLVALFIFLLLFLFLGVIDFNAKLHVKLHNHVEKHIEEIINPSIIAFTEEIEKQKEKVEVLSLVFASDEINFESAWALNLLQEFKVENDLLNCIAITIAEDSNDELLQYLNHEEDLEKVKKDTVIREVERSDAQGKEHIGTVIAAPIIRDNQFIGIVVCEFPPNHFRKTLSVDMFDKRGEVFIVNNMGQIVIGDSTYFPKSLKLSEYLNGENASFYGESQKSDMESQSGIMLLNMKKQNENYYLSFKTLGINNWYMVGVVTEGATLKTFESIFSIIKNYLTAAGILLMICIAAVMFCLIMSNKNRDRKTGCYTRRKFLKEVRKKIKYQGAVKYVFIKLDVKNLKLINRMYGFEYGDKIIINTAKALKTIVEDNDGLMCRDRVDEFIFFMKYEGAEKLEKDRSKFIELFNLLMIKEHSTNIMFPTGQFVIDFNKKKKIDLNSVMENLYFAHKKAKMQENSLVIDYDEDVVKKEINEKYIIDVMDDVLKRKHFKLYLQPKVSASNLKICGAEALVRWEDEEGNIIKYPNEFIPIFEQVGFITKLDMYIFEEVVKYLKKLQDEERNLIKVSINFSRMHIIRNSFIQDLNNITTYYGVPNKYLEIEITETVFTENIEEISTLVNKAHEYGFSIAMDDFGSGYSSLGLLKNIEIDVLKIDREFFVDEIDYSRSEAVVKSVLNLAHDLNINTVAEGIETYDKVEMMIRLKCDEIQGYYFYRPMQVDKFDNELMKDNKEYR